MTEEEEFEFRLRLESESAAAPEPEEEKGFGERSLDKLQLGLSDAMSTMAGDTYGRTGATSSLNPFGGDSDAGPTDRTPIPMLERTMAAVGGNILPAAGDVVGDAVSSVTPQPVKDVLKSGLDKAMNFKGLLGAPSINEMVPVASEALEYVPEDVKRRTGEVANVMGVVGGPKVDFKAKEALKKSMDRMRRRDIKKKYTPENIEADENYGKVTEEGLLNTKKYSRSQGERVRDAEIEKIEGLDPRRSARHNTTELEGKVDKLRVDLDESLAGRPGIAVDSVRTKIDDAINRAGASPTMVGDAEKSAKKIYAELDRLLLEVTENGVVKPGDLLTVRRDLDSWIRKNTPKAFDPGVVGANQIATREIRTGINNIINEAVPDAGVAQSLKSQADLLGARDSLTLQRLREGKSGLSRAVSKVEGDTGLTPATSPLATKANITDAAAMLILGAGTLASLGTRGAIVAGKKLSAAAKMELEAAIKNGSRASVLAILNAEESYEGDE